VLDNSSIKDEYKNLLSISVLVYRLQNYLEGDSLEITKKDEI
jgi:hypothetical protein